MNTPQVIAIFLLGVGFGALLIWLQQIAVRRQFRQEIVSQIDQALFGGLRRRHDSEQRAGLTATESPGQGGQGTR